MKFIFALASLVLGGCAAEKAVSHLELKYAFEIVRHGARAPMLPDPRFTTEHLQQLTPQGMRQRFLLGRYNYEKYGKDLGGSQMMQRDAIEVTSTNVFRTLQSGYSELQGMTYQAKGARPALTEKQAKALQLHERGQPPMHVRRSDELHQHLSRFAIVEGFAAVPIFTSIEATLENDLASNGCQFYREVRAAREASAEAFKDVDYTVQDLAADYTEVFNDTFHLT